MKVFENKIQKFIFKQDQSIYFGRKSKIDTY